MTTLDEAQRARLPKAARLAFEALESRVASLEEALAEALGDVQGADVFVDGYPDRRPVGRGKRLVFVLGAGREVRLHREGDRLVIMGSGACAIEASASNHFRVRVVR